MMHEIEDIVTQIQKRFDPEKIILFGSHAYGTPDEDSDVDLLVVMDWQGSARNQAVKILQNLQYHVPLDLIVRSPKQINKRINEGDFFLKDLLEKGKVVYEQDNQ